MLWELCLRPCGRTPKYWLIRMNESIWENVMAFTPNGPADKVLHYYKFDKNNRSMTKIQYWKDLHSYQEQVELWFIKRLKYKELLNNRYYNQLVTPLLCKTKRPLHTAKHFNSGATLHWQQYTIMIYISAPQPLSDPILFSKHMSQFNSTQMLVPTRNSLQ
jgi:hypothetical protein